jgi:hypothetical protein
MYSLSMNFMEVERVRELRNARPFVPFRIFRNDGDPVTVTNPEAVGIGPGGNWLLVSLPDEGHAHINTGTLTRVEVIGFPTVEDLEFL